MRIIKPRGDRTIRVGYPSGHLTASGKKVNRANSSDFRRLIQPWQQASLGYYATVGECWYAAQFYARSLAKLRVYAAKRDDQGEVKEIEDTNDDACQFLARVQDRNGGTSQLFASYGRLRFLTGEGYLTVTSDSEDPEDEEWEFLSSNELRIGPGGYVRYRAPGINSEEYEVAPDEAFVPIQGEGARKQAVVYRLWQRHPDFSDWADSPMHGVLSLFEELSLLQLAVGARAKSRASGPGILYIPTEFSFGSADGQRNDDPNNDPVTRAITESLMAAVKNPGSAGSVAPIVFRGPAMIGGVPAKDSIFKIEINNPMETYPETGLRNECIKRIATGLDMPPELLLGMTDANHWTAWQIDDATYTAHIQPVCEQLVSDLNSAYLRPALREAGYADWRNITIGYDAADIINHPDRNKDALDLYDRGAIGYETLRETGGFSDDDAQTPEEHDEWLAVKLRDKTFILDTGQTQINQADESSGATLPSNEPKPQSAEEGPPENPDDVSQESLGASALSLQVIAAAEMTVERIRELAGSRIRGKASKCEECQELISPVSNSLVASALGKDKTVELIGDLALTAGGTEIFRSTCLKWGIEDAVADTLGKLIERHAQRSLYMEQAEPLPQKFSEYVAKVI